MSTINDEPQIDDAFVIHVSSIDDYSATLNIRVRMNNRWLYMNKIFVLPGDEIIVSDNGSGKSDTIIGSSEAIIEAIPHKFEDELKSRVL